MGIRGTVRRSTDSWFVHCNIDTDVIIWDGDPTDPTRKPPETYSLIENFCLGTRRLEIFGKLSSLRKGWVTALSANAGAPSAPKQGGAPTDATPIPWDKATWDAGVHRENGKCVVPSSQEIEILRPKSPLRGPPNNAPNMPNMSNTKPPFSQQFPPQPSPHPQTPAQNAMLGKPLHMGFHRHQGPGPNMVGQMGMPMGVGMGMGAPMGMGINMNMGMGVGMPGMPGMRMNEFGFGGPGGMGMMPNMPPGGMGAQMMFGPGQMMWFNSGNMNAGFNDGNVNMGFDRW
ncbi:hypothetical protein FRC08_004799 [Ceratobasidium sp. 394]|nr:hypothetical protein FRC08_004799 [Ceratobasidium sp. 394]